MNKLKPKGRGDGHILDYSQITDNVYIGSDLCKGGVCLIHSDEFKKLVVCVEINLSAEAKEYPPDDIDIYSWIPVVDGHAPTKNQLVIGTALINEAVENGKVAYVHCKNGHGRSPTLVAAYFIRYQNMGVNEAISLIKEKRPEVHIEKIQRKALEALSDK